MGLVRTGWSLGAAVLAWAYFAHRMLDGGYVVDQSAGSVLTAFIAVVIFMVVAEAAIAGWWAARTRAAGGIESDERDVAIAAEAGRWESGVVIAGINVLVIQLIAEEAFAGHIFPRIDLTHMPALVFWLVSILFAGHITRLAVTVWRYRV